MKQTIDRAMAEHGAEARANGVRHLDLDPISGRWRDRTHIGPGKGDRNRSVDKQRFDENFDKIDWSK